MKTGTMLGLAFLVSVAVGFSYFAGYAHGRIAGRSVAKQRSGESVRSEPVAEPTAEAAVRPTSAPAESGLAVTGLGREAILQMLPGKTWYSHWETRDRARPTQFRVLNNGQVQFGATENNLTLELRWVLNQGGHLFVPIDQRTIHGFYIPTGRQKGFFADQ